MSAPTRTFVDGVESKPDAYELAAGMAKILVRAGLTLRYGVSVHRIPISRGDTGWGVWLTDRTPDQAPPAGVPFLALPSQFTTAA
ncbi:hypothetical protein XF35_41485 [Streptomyces platensis subsp. clarensis]|uniref:Uncharacterized protein n=1 Tax=Streptomyces showdoensis TaxID=68268 RepID=A0A2P2GR11_STREW|nr:hypothetical protein VO63_10060 [Streptomyces showdoensis]MCW7991500.1 hypothetical protein [Streptomyces platensis subsp. clarensis]